MTTLDDLTFHSTLELETHLEKMSDSPKELVHFLQENVLHGEDEKRSKEVKEWSSWCKAQTKRVRCVEADIPDGILPPKTKGSLIDIKVTIKMYNPKHFIGTISFI